MLKRLESLTTDSISNDNHDIFSSKTCKVVGEVWLLILLILETMKVACDNTVSNFNAKTLSLRLLRALLKLITAVIN